MTYLSPSLSIFADRQRQLQRHHMMPFPIYVVRFQTLPLEVVERTHLHVDPFQHRFAVQLTRHVRALREHVLVEEALHVARRIVVGHHVKVAGLAAANAGAQFPALAPDQLREVARFVGKLWVVVVVVGHFLVPSLGSPKSGRHETLAEVDVLAVLAVGAMLQNVDFGQML